MTTEGASTSSPENGYRQGLNLAAASLCLEAGFDSVQHNALETLTEMLQSYLTEVGNSTRCFYEHSGRTMPTPKDIIFALSNMGFSNKDLPQYVARRTRISLGPLSKTNEPTSPPVFQVGTKKKFPNYIPENTKFPVLPDPHTYIRTMTGQKPESDYVILRERASAQKRDVERALTRFVAKTGQSDYLLPDDKNAFPLISAKPKPMPYLSALIPSELETVKLHNEKNLKIDNEELQSDTTEKKQTPKNRKLKRSSDLLHDNIHTDSHIQSQSSDIINTKQLKVQSEQSSVNHNPFLRPAKITKSKKKAR